MTNAATFDPTKYTKSRWLKSSDIPEGGLLATVQWAAEHLFERDQTTKPILSFLELDQDLVLNKTRVTVMINGFGTDPKQWEGKQVQLTTAPSSMGATIVVSPVQQQPPATPPAPQPVPVAPTQPVAPGAAMQAQQQPTGEVLFQ